MATLSLWSYRHRRIVAGAWAVLLVFLVAVGHFAGSNFENNFRLPDTDSARAISTLQREFPQASGETDAIVFHTPNGKVTDPETAQRIESVVKRVGESGAVVAVLSPIQQPDQVSADGKTGFASVVFRASDGGVSKSQIERLITVARSAQSADLQVEFSGDSIGNLNKPGIGLSMFIGIGAAAIVLCFAFGSLLAMTLPLLIALVSLLAGLAAISLLSHAFSVADFAPTLAALIGLGVGVDYALFIVTRHRSNLQHGMSVQDSVVLALCTAGRAVLFAGSIVCIALLGMFALGVSFLYGVAVSATIVVAFTMMTSVTLLPALLGLYGMRVLSRRTRRQLELEGFSTAEERSPGWYRWGAFVERHPAPLAAIAAVVMILLAVPFFSLRLGSTDQGNDPAGSTTRRAYDLLASGFGPGFNGPFEVVLQVRGSADLAVAQDLQQRLSAAPGVAQVGAVEESPNGKAAVIQVYPTTSPQSAGTTDLLQRLRSDVIPAAVGSSGAIVHVGGITAVTADFASVLSKKLPIFIGVVVGLAFLLLAAVFRSLLVPLTASVMNLLATASAFGIVVAVFQWGWFGDLIGIGKTGPIEPFVPVMMFAILFGLSMDYEVFLVSRIHEDWLHRLDNSEAVTLGQAETGRVITAAATIMVLVFASFVFGGERIIKLFGVGLAAAVFLDAVVVRTILVPALMHLFGRANWWMPRWLDKLLPWVDIEGPDGVPPEGRQPHIPVLEQEPIRTG